MKRILVAAFLLLLIITMSGCRPVTGDISDLMSFPKLTVEQQAIEKALDNVEGSGKYTLKYPREGNYRSAFILHNLDNDSEQEAIAFYCPNAENAGTHVMILKKIKNQWKKVSEFSGNGNDVDQIDFGDFYGKGYDDIAIAWTQLTETNLGLDVYTEKGEKYTIDGTFTEMKTVDLTNDGKKDILLLRLDSTMHKASASLISDKNGTLQEIAKPSPLDPTVSSYAGIYNAKVDNKNAVLIDGYNGQHGMITELLTFTNGVLESPLYDKGTKTVTMTRRTVPITCEDFNGDGVYDIPSAVELPGYANKTDFNQKLWLVSWSAFSNGALSSPSFSCVMNNTQGYYFIYPQKWGASVTVDSSAGDNDWAFKVWDGSKMTDTLFSIQVYPESDWANTKENGNTGNTFEVAENNGVVYVATLSPKSSGDDQYIEMSEIKQGFKVMD